MPQMKPSKWTLLLTITTSMIMMIMSSLYFSISLSEISKISSNSNKISHSKFLWAWKW